MTLILLTFNFLLRHDYDLLEIEKQRNLASIISLPLFIKLLDWMQLFSEYAFYISLIIETIYDIKQFMIIMIILYLMFGIAFFMIDQNHEPDEKYLSGNYKFWVFDAFYHTYSQSLGEFSIDAYSESTYDRYLLTFFMLATFMIMIIFMNMLIAIMGDTFAFAMENRMQSSRLTQIKKVADSVHLINKQKAKITSLLHNNSGLSTRNNRKR